MAPSIYLVDDNLTFLNAVTGFLKHVPDVSVIGQSTEGRDALVQVARLQPDLVLLDIGLPDMNGLDVAQAMAEWSQSPHIIFLSMHETEAYVGRAIKVGAMGYINKADFVDEFPVLLAIFATLPPRCAPT